MPGNEAQFACGMVYIGSQFYVPSAYIYVLGNDGLWGSLKCNNSGLRYLYLQCLKFQNLADGLIANYNLMLWIKLT